MARSDRLLKIAIVDDDDVDAIVLHRVLSKIDKVSLQTFTSPKALFSSECCKDVDLIFTDIMMPEMDGLELIQQAKSLPHGPKIVTVSGSFDRSRSKSNRVDYLQVAEAFGAHASITKDEISKGLPDKIFQLIERC